MKKKTKSGKKVVSKHRKAKSALQIKVQEALQVTWLLKGKLKCIQIACLKIGELLARVRDEKMYKDLSHPDVEDYAEKRLNLGRASFYRYLQAYDWVKANHSEWLEPKPKGFIPELNDITDLKWMENELKKKTLSKETRAGLEALRTKALEGRLRDKDLDNWRKKGRRAGDGLETFLTKLRLMRKRGSDLKNMPEEAVKLMDSLIEMIRNAVTAQ